MPFDGNSLTYAERVVCDKFMADHNLTKTPLLARMGPRELKEFYDRCRYTPCTDGIVYAVALEEPGMFEAFGDDETDLSDRTWRQGADDVESGLPMTMQGLPQELRVLDPVEQVFKTGHGVSFASIKAAALKLYDDTDFANLDAFCERMAKLHKLDVELLKAFIYGVI